MKSHDVTSIAGLRSAIEALPRWGVDEMLIEIAACLAFDEVGEYNPEESLAADSAADFVESVTHIFHRNRISL